MSSDNTPTPLCPDCKQPLTPGNRFCEHCGAAAVPAATCPSCGAEIGQKAQFCGKCGAPAGTAQATAAPEEPVIGVIGNARVPKMFGLGGDTYTLVITGRRMILAKLTQQMINDAVREAQQAAKAAGKGFFGQMGSQMAAVGSYARRYLAMLPEQILAEVPGNRAIENQHITAVKVSVQESEDSQNTCRLLVQSGGEKTEFVIPEHEQASALVKQVYGDRADVPGSSKGVTIKLF